MFNCDIVCSIDMVEIQLHLCAVHLSIDPLLSSNIPKGFQSWSMAKCHACSLQNTHLPEYLDWSTKLLSWPWKSARRGTATSLCISQLLHPTSGIPGVNEHGCVWKCGITWYNPKMAILTARMIGATARFWGTQNFRGWILGVPEPPRIQNRDVNNGFFNTTISGIKWSAWWLSLVSIMNH